MFPRSRRRLLVTLLLFALGAAAFWLLRGWGIQSGDYEQYRSLEIYGVRRPIYHVREPGAVLLWQGVTWLAVPRRPADAVVTSPWASELRVRGGGELSPEERAVGFAALGALSGGAYLVFLAAFLGKLGRSGRGARALAAACVLASAITWTFVGHMEFYAPLYAALMFYYWRAIRYFRDRSFRNFAWVFVGAAVAVTMHRAAAFHLPALVWLFRGGAGESRFRRPARGEAVAMLCAVLAVCVPHLVIVGLSALDLARTLVVETYNWLPELLTPFTRGWAEYVRANSQLGSFHLFLFGSLEHWKHFLFFWGVGSPVAIMAAAVFGWRGRRTRRSWNADEAFLALSALCAGVWALFWHPHMGYGDWDLFVNPSLPLNLLAAMLAIRASTAKSSGTISSGQSTGS